MNHALVQSVVDETYRSDSRRVLATLIRLLGDFDLAEEALHEAFAAAVDQWQREGVPQNPRAWLVSTGRFKAIDALRRRARHVATLAEMALHRNALESKGTPSADEASVEDDQLRLIFTCCHPAIAPQVQVALTLREVCGLTTEAIAAAFLVSPTTMAQRIVRGKSKIRDAGIPYDIPTLEDLPDRLDNVLAVIYLVFNEGYAASSGEQMIRPDLSSEAIRLGRLLAALLPEPEVLGLLALMLFHESRRNARVDASGDLILLEDQDRSKWNQTLIEEGRPLIERAFAGEWVGPYAIQAAIAAEHALAGSASDTNWSRIVPLYDMLLRSTASPVVELNRAVAIGMRDGFEAGLTLVNALLDRGDLKGYHLAYATRADFCRRLGKLEEAREAYATAMELAQQDPERRFLAKRLAEISNSGVDFPRSATTMS